MYRIARPAILLAAILAAIPAVSGAQTLSAGPRMSFLRPDAAAPGTPRERFTGGTLRLATSSRTALELAMDWRSTTNADQTFRVRDYPVQGSLLVYPMRGAVAPYVLGGIGWYSQQLAALTGGEVTAEQSTRRVGYHAGFGADVGLGHRMAVYADYRYTFIGFRRDTEAGAGGGFGIPGVGGLLDHVGLSHEGAMWTSGVVFRF